LCVVCSALASDGSGQISDGGIDMNTAVSTGNYASGTNCRASATCGAAAEADTTPYWDTVVFTDLTLGIGGTAVKTVLPGGRP
jgi:hypothetical protein